MTRGEEARIEAFKRRPKPKKEIVRDRSAERGDAGQHAPWLWDIGKR